jgi:hypothetical protein
VQRSLPFQRPGSGVRVRRAKTRGAGVVSRTHPSLIRRCSSSSARDHDGIVVDQVVAGAGARSKMRASRTTRGAVGSCVGTAAPGSGGASRVYDEKIDIVAGAPTTGSSSPSPVAARVVGELNEDTKARSWSSGQPAVAASGSRQNARLAAADRLAHRHPRRLRSPSRRSGGRRAARGRARGPGSEAMLPRSRSGRPPAAERSPRTGRRRSDPRKTGRERSP